MALIPLFLIIFLTVFFIRRQSRKKSVERKKQFISYCQNNGLQVDYFMQRRYGMAVLSVQTNQIAWIDLRSEGMKDPLILSVQPGAKPTLNVVKSKKSIQKIALKPTYLTPKKDDPEIIFYDWLQDDETKLDAYMTEGEKWDKALKSI